MVSERFMESALAFGVWRARCYGVLYQSTDGFMRVYPSGWYRRVFCLEASIRKFHAICIGCLTRL